VVRHVDGDHASSMRDPRFGTSRTMIVNNPGFRQVGNGERLSKIGISPFLFSFQCDSIA
jgi:hypothetical protein